MANYYSKGRTNHFAVKDPEAFQAEVTPLVEEGEVIREERDGVDGFILLFPEGIPTQVWNPEDEEADEPMEIDWVSLISGHLADGEVCVIQEIGWERLRYLTGYAVAFNNKGEKENINIYNIYDQAKELGTRITQAEY